MVEHVNIEDSQRHEPRHASSAALNTVNKSNGDGTTKYDFVNWSEIAGKPSSSAYSVSLYGASSASSQAPTATNTPVQIEFGAAQSNSDVSLSASGVLTFTTAGFYLIQTNFEFGRTSTTGNIYLFTRALYNGSQLRNSNATVLSAALQTQSASYTYVVNASAGDTMSFQIVRDAAGANDGSLVSTTTTTSGWAPAPSASITVSKFRGLV